MPNSMGAAEKENYEEDAGEGVTAQYTRYMYYTVRRYRQSCSPK